MADKKNDIRDDEFRILGTSSAERYRYRERSTAERYEDGYYDTADPYLDAQLSTPPPTLPTPPAVEPRPSLPEKTEKRSNWLSSLLAWLLLLGIALFFFFKWPKSDSHESVAGNNDVVSTTAPPEDVISVPSTATDQTFTEKIDTVINDIPLSILIPHNATPRLTVGAPDLDDKSIILAVQAADIRDDNKEILGAFILDGKLLAKGISKKGFCAIIDGKITIGMAESTPLFEEAIEKNGYFFRQYPLVSDGVLINSGPKGKSLRRALCTDGKQVFVTISQTEESFHDFSQALVDLGVQNAIYLCGGTIAQGWYRQDKDNTSFLLTEENHQFKNENHILWTSCTTI